VNAQSAAAPATLNCTPTLRQQARQCLLPLMLKWSAMNENLTAVRCD